MSAAILGPSKYRVTYNLARTNAAEFSCCGKYRYLLRRCFDGDVLAAPENPVLFVMLNPSTADALQDDPTIRRCMGFARSWGHSDLIVANMFALRATNPKELISAVDPVGPDNDDFLRLTPKDIRTIVAWGSNKAVTKQRVARVVELLDRPLFALKHSASGTPWHPLYLPANLQPQPWSST